MCVVTSNLEPLKGELGSKKNYNLKTVDKFKNFVCKCYKFYFLRRPLISAPYTFFFFFLNKHLNISTR